MDQFVVEFYEMQNGERPAEEFLNELDAKMRSKLVMTLKVLQEKGNALREPYSKSQKTPRGEIEKAKAYRKDFLERMGG